MCVYLFIFSLSSYIFQNTADIIIDSSNYNIKNVNTVRYMLSDGGMQLSVQDNLYNFTLEEENSIFLATVKIFIHKERGIRRLTLSNIPGSSLYKGFLINRKETSTLLGYFYDGMFIGTFTYGSQRYYVEPTNEYFNNKVDKTGIFYNMRDVDFKPKYPDGKLICEATNTEKYRKLKSYERHYFDFKLKNFTILVKNLLMRKTRICSLELLADHTYAEYMQLNRGKIVAEMLLHVKMADNIFRNTDFDGDDRGDDIAFSVEKITIYETKDEPGYPLSTETNDYKIFLKHLTRYKHPYCMLICFCHRDFRTNTQCAVSKVTKIGGICPESKKLMPNKNVAFISSLENNYNILRSRIALNLVHQLGHAFGCHHDPESNRFCSPGDTARTEGNYIMHPRLPYGTFKNNWKFSFCCTNTIKNFFKISRIEKCLKKRGESICGNGIVEEGETCDCDSSKEICTDVERCCSLNEYSSKCTVRKEKTCSPIKGQCCDENCDIVKSDKKQTCFSNIECFNTTSLCNGSSPFCYAVIQSDVHLADITLKRVKKGNARATSVPMTILNFVEGSSFRMSYINNLNNINYTRENYRSMLNLKSINRISFKT
ncbi:disintegrin and metalloproteinase domain-containing protein 10-like isoform X1 [Centruroides sculpturatus]|uniref:disintegrin and metalloproteinase domain-containing protein 10-like isoform X1 n=2 Tax=Centruroides sculpturatus TaxID=218467 RepID=UPI000C6C8C67|nr:disintegrin and metalloproteinase domain-containing protein 10-like isoform X1 [Centruroides sculpturatus]